MKIARLICCAALVACLVLLSHGAAAAALGLGEKAPASDVKMKSVDGSEVTIAESAGEAGTLVIFTCNHCPYVKAWAERIVEIGNTYASKGVGVIAINANDPGVFADDGFEDMRKRAEKQGMTYPYVVDATSDVARAFGASRTPEVFLFDAAGKLVYHGTIDDNVKEASAVTKHYLRDALDALLAGEEIPLAETKALGCSIKFRS